jgi:hypothetical protein
MRGLQECVLALNATALCTEGKKGKVIKHYAMMACGGVNL